MQLGDRLSKVSDARWLHQSLPLYALLELSLE